jgi:saccharopine dehydrogenase-like NADP-dependent oxidoreductase
MKPLDLDQAVAISVYTGVLCCNFSDMHSEVERRLGRLVSTHEFASKKFFEDEIKPAFKDDFLALCNLGPTTEAQ